MSQLEKLKRTRRWLEAVHARVIQQNDDRVVVVIGDEGAGKSTFMVTLARFWQQIRGGDTSVDGVLSQIVWGGRDAFNKALKSWDEGSMIAVQDAPHVLFSREAMHGDQIEVEKNLLDVRVRNFLIVLGFQDFDDMPSGLKQRRAKNAFVIPTRGSVHGYNRESIDRRYKDGEWPQPDFEDRFPALDGTDLWEQFQERDTQAKLDRLEQSDADQSPEEAAREQAIKTALKAIKPWKPKQSGMTQAEAAELVDYSRSWVADRKKEWEQGYHRDLFEDDPTVPDDKQQSGDRGTAA